MDLEIFSFMDAYSDYNQIPMCRKDEESTSFTLEFSTFCFKMISFGLKNAGATFQRLMNKIFKNQIRKNLEVYVDDILVKSLREEDHPKDLEETFQNLQRSRITIKPNKCTF